MGEFSPIMNGKKVLKQHSTKVNHRPSISRQQAAHCTSKVWSRYYCGGTDHCDVTSNPRCLGVFPQYVQKGMLISNIIQAGKIADVVSSTLVLISQLQAVSFYLCFSGICVCVCVCACVCACACVCLIIHLACIFTHWFFNIFCHFITPLEKIHSTLHRYGTARKAVLIPSSPALHSGKCSAIELPWKLTSQLCKGR